MAIVKTTDIEKQVEHVLAQYEQQVWSILQNHLSISKDAGTEERLLHLWKLLDGGGDIVDAGSDEEIYASLMVGPSIQLRHFINDGIVPLGFVLGRLVHIGGLIGQFSEVIQSEREDPEKLRAHIRQHVSDRAQHAVSHRPDQLLKPKWLAHCQRVLTEGKTIQYLDDLLNEPGYDLEILKIQQATLRKWARDEAGITFKSGRPKTDRSR